MLAVCPCPAKKILVSDGCCLVDVVLDSLNFPHDPSPRYSVRFTSFFWEHNPNRLGGVRDNGQLDPGREVVCGAPSQSSRGFSSKTFVRVTPLSSPHRGHRELVRIANRAE